MTDSVLNIPRHIGRLRIVSADRVALVMAGVSFKAESIIDAENNNYTFWNEAKIYKESILQAIKLKEITPIKVLAPLPASFNGSMDDEMVLEPHEININTYITNADFLASEIWPWAKKELSEDSFSERGHQYHKQESISSGVADKSQESIDVLKNKIAELEKDIQDLKKSLPCHIGSFFGGADKDPLFQAIRIRNTEWVNYDPNNSDTRVNQQSIITDLRTNHGFVEATAKAIEKVACPIDRNPSKTA
ncbi:hypothetical protein [Pectobacterium zantedeschiae]|uniref:hypothetical protein n=1 Tax=Pectobacterium zantedeschiae TaxID=2034769 RepID=UPI00101CB6BC|nr:hypothetical protein [Pectobacterium zantedeschiae]RYC47309.1 hypothetical protein DEH81_02695 [Pectobacterium zantedeschiae]